MRKLARIDRVIRADPSRQGIINKMNELRFVVSGG
jgi:hypothetical protein